MVSKKHLISIAKVINLIPEKTTRDYIARSMYLELSQYNPRIDRDKFLTACGSS